MGEGLNRVVLFGNLAKDPELRRLPGGQPLLVLRLATNYSFVNREGVREEKAEWHRVSVWGNRGEGLARILHKGSFVLVEGELRTRSYEKEGRKHWVTDVHASNVILGGRCGPSGHHADMDPPDDEEHGFEQETLRDDGFDVPALSARRARDSERPPRAASSGDAEGPTHEAEDLQPSPSEPPPRGNSGNGGATPPPPPPPRKKARAHSTQASVAA